MTAGRERRKMKKSKKKSPLGILLIILGIILISSAFLLYMNNVREEKDAGKSAESLLVKAEEKIEKLNETSEVSSEKEASEEMKIEDYYDLDGILTIPELSLKLPVLSDYSDDLLKVSVCVYESTGDTNDGKVIAGHNYRYHFGPLLRLKEGAEVTYENMDGSMHDYTVTLIEEIDEKDYGALDGGAWDMTLLTCNKDMKKRVLVRLTEN